MARISPETKVWDILNIIHPLPEGDRQRKIQQEKEAERNFSRVLNQPISEVFTPEQLQE